MVARISLHFSYIDEIKNQHNEYVKILNFIEAIVSCSFRLKFAIYYNVVKVT